MQPTHINQIDKSEVDNIDDLLTESAIIMAMILGSKSFNELHELMIEMFYQEENKDWLQHHYVNVAFDKVTVWQTNPEQVLYEIPR
jgi:predicted RNA-binding protein with RPS1 domain